MSVGSAPQGVAVPDRINLFRANALRSVGGNTWRTSHNPYNPVMYDVYPTAGMMYYAHTVYPTAGTT